MKRGGSGCFPGNSLLTRLYRKAAADYAEMLAKDLSWYQALGKSMTNFYKNTWPDKKLKPATRGFCSYSARLEPGRKYALVCHYSTGANSRGNSSRT